MAPLEKLGKYDVQAIIGRGSAGVVYAGLDPVLSRPVAIKVLPLDIHDDYDREQYERFKREAQAAARMHHRHIVAIYDYGETERHAFIVMEHLDGGSLKARLEREGILPLPDVQRILRELLDGLQHSHDNGVVHRDVKPANVVFSRSGDLKITDFGIARLDAGGMTRDGSTLGTPAYMAPEQITGDTVDARTDLYAAGVMLFEMLTGHRPFNGSAQSVMHKILNLPVPQLGELSPPAPRRFDAILARAMAKAPHQRFGSAAEMSQALDAAFALPEIATGAGRTTRTPPAAEPPRGSGDETIAYRETARPDSPRRAASATEDSGKRTRWPLLVGAVISTAIIGVGAWTALAPSRDRSRNAAPASDVEAPPVLPPPPAAPAGQPAPPTAPLEASSGAAPPPSPQARPDAPPPVAIQATPAPARTDPVAQWRTAIATVVDTLPCSLLGGDISGAGDVELTGLTGLGDMAQLEASSSLRRAIAQAVPITAMHWHVAHVDGPYCAVLAALKPYTSRFGGLASGDRLEVAQGGRDVRITLKTAMPTALIDRYLPDGSVVHLRKGNAPTSIGTAAGTGALIVAIASSVPLPLADRPEREEAAGYTVELRAALERAQALGTRVVADAVGLDAPP